MALKLVTVATDGVTHHIITPDGCRYNLGSTPVVRLVTSLIKDRRKARAVLDEFLQEGSASFVADLDLAEALFMPLRTRWGAEAFPFIPPLNRLPEIPRGTIMADTSEKALDQAINQQISEIEDMISLIERKVKEAEKGSLSYEMMSNDIANLRKLVKSIGKAPSGQSNNRAFYASVDVLETNAKIAEDILNKIDATRTTVERLATEGRKFNASAARMDLHVLASTVHSILTDTDLAMSYVTADLKAVADRMDHIHGLFAGAK